MHADNYSVYFQLYYSYVAQRPASKPGQTKCEPMEPDMSWLNIFKGEQPLIKTYFHGDMDKGEFGEYLTEYALTHGLIPGRYHVYTNLLVPKPGTPGQTTEVDVLMLHEKGVLVFESKNYSGWIFGSADEPKWTASLNKYTKEQFYNPIMQNRTHVRALAEYLGLCEEAFLSYIVFSERCELKEVPPDTDEYRIIQRQNLVREVKHDLRSLEAVHTLDDLRRLKSLLDELAADSTTQARKDHAERVQRTCPWCGKPLVERTRRADGGIFIGCTGYPECRYTRNEW